MVLVTKILFWCLWTIKDTPDFVFESFDNELIGSLLATLDTSKATGADGLPLTFVKVLHSFFSIPITLVINRSLSSGVVPQEWKRAIVTPIPKKRNTTGLSDFRPISVLPIFSKIMECVVQFQVIDHLLLNGLLSPYQSGFRPGYSTQDVLHHVLDAWLEHLDNHKCVGAIFLDLARAFDCVDHIVLFKNSLIVVL